MAGMLNSSVVLIANLPFGTEPAWIHKNLVSGPFKEIEMVHDQFYVHLATLAEAQAFSGSYNGTSAGEKSHTYKKEISVKVISITDAPKPTDVSLRLTEFLQAEKHMPSTKTVRLRALPEGHPRRAVMEMCNEAFDCYEEEDYRQLHIEIINSHYRPEALVRFTSKEAACVFVDEYNGAYWKNATTYAECVNDAELDSYIQSKKGSGRKDMKLFINAVKPNASRALFAPYQLKDIVMKPGKPFAFFFLHKDTASKFLADFPPKKGKRHDGWAYCVRRAEDEKTTGR